MDTEMNRLNSENHSFVQKIESLHEQCKEDAQILEKLRTRNIENRNTLYTSFTGQVYNDKFKIFWFSLIDQ